MPLLCLIPFPAFFNRKTIIKANPRNVSLKIVNSGIILKTFTHAIIISDLYFEAYTREDKRMLFRQWRWLLFVHKGC